MKFGDYPVLLVDDEVTNRVVTEHTLAKHFSVVSADSGEKALEILSSRPISVLLTDHRLPGMSGVDLTEKVYLKYPDVVRIIITAYSDLPTALDAINRGKVNRFIKKPWTPEELIMVVKQAIELCRKDYEIKKLREKQFHFDRMRSLGILSSGIAHDIRQPLSYVGHFIHAIGKDLKKVRELTGEGEIIDLLNSIEDDLSDVSRGLSVLSALSKNLLNHVSNIPIEREIVDINELVDGVLSISHLTLKKYSKFCLDMPAEKLKIVCCQSRLSQLILNLLLNAAQSITSGDPQENMIKLKICLNDGVLLIEVSDTGCGIKEEIRRKIFEPSFSTKRQNGIGLGLSICKQNVEDLEGKIEIETAEGRGATFRVCIPVDEKPHVM